MADLKLLLKDLKLLKCKLCDIIFSRKSSLKRHIFRKHPDGGELALTSTTVLPRKPKIYKCKICDKCFSFKSGLCRHTKKFHPNATTKSENLENTSSFISVELNSMKEFLDWKTRQEEITNSRFIKTSVSRKNLRGQITRKYRCNRSGQFKSRSKGLRRGRLQGSIKSGFKCPASMTAYIRTDGTVMVRYNSIHAEHPRTLSIIKMKKRERAHIARMLESGISIDDILDIRIKHDASKLIPLDKMTRIEKKMRYTVLGPDNKTYTIQRNTNLPHSKGLCALRCLDCKVCIHTYVCSCFNYGQQLKICEHIHMISEFENDGKIDNSSRKKAGAPVVWNGNLDNFEEVDAILASIPTTTPAQNLETHKSMQMQIVKAIVTEVGEDLKLAAAFTNEMKLLKKKMIEYKKNGIPVPVKEKKNDQQLRNFEDATKYRKRGQKAIIKPNNNIQENVEILNVIQHMDFDTHMDYRPSYTPYVCRPVANYGAEVIRAHTQNVCPPFPQHWPQNIGPY